MTQTPDLPLGDPRPAGEEGPAGDQRPAGNAGPGGDPRQGGRAKLTDAAVTKAADSEREDPDDANPDTGAYDPGEHGVAEVKDHLATVTDDAERERILAAERAGSARKGILGQ